jgi:NADH-quinone oxidoreductase subunit J
MSRPRLGIALFVSAVLLAAFTLISAPALSGDSAAQAQPAKIKLPAGGQAKAAPAAKADKVVKVEVADKRKLGNGKATGVMFWVFSLMVIGLALVVITRKNLIAAVMGMVGCFFGVAAVYLMLFASFIAVIQVLVYAGAIMVLFVFVIMILNRPIEDTGWRENLLGKGLAALAVLYLVFRLGGVMWSYVPAKTASLESLKAVEFGSTATVGKALFNDYLFPFEAVSIVLLVSIVGAIAVARPNAKRETAEQASGAEVE